MSRGRRARLRRARRRGRSVRIVSVILLAMVLGLLSSARAGPPPLHIVLTWATAAQKRAAYFDLDPGVDTRFNFENETAGGEARVNPVGPFGAIFVVALDGDSVDSRRVLVRIGKPFQSALDGGATLTTEVRRGPF